MSPLEFGFFHLVFEIYPYCWVFQQSVWMYHSLLIHASVEGQLGCFQFGVTMDKAAINMDIEILCKHKFSFLLRLNV